MSRLILLLKNQKIEIYKFYLNFFYIFSIYYIVNYFFYKYIYYKKFSIRTITFMQRTYICYWICKNMFIGITLKIKNKIT